MQIRSLKHATTSKAMFGMGVRLSSSPSKSVELYLADFKVSLIFRIDNEARLIAEWEKRRDGKGVGREWGQIFQLDKWPY